MKPSQRTFIALDNLEREQLESLLPKLSGRVYGIKIGLEMYLRFGRDFVLKAKSLFNGKIFLDLKLHDIPNTVAKAIAGLEGLPVDFLTVHASGGEAMLVAAKQALGQSLPGAQILAVTVLTSLDDHDSSEIFNSDRRETFKRHLKLITKAQTGLVCSGAELSQLAGHNVVSMVPGIRFKSEIESGKTQDQKSVFTPKQALENGATYLVVGRSITSASNIESALIELDN